jgi:hypothetical protein
MTLDVIEAQFARSAVVPQPNLAPCFVARAVEVGLVTSDENGADDSTPSRENLNGAEATGFRVGTAL